MIYHFAHTLVLTPFESTLTQLDWETVAAQDYPVHALYCKELNRFIFFSNSTACDCQEKINEIYSLLDKLAIQFVYEQQIITLSDNENEYNEQDVLRYFNH